MANYILNKMFSLSYEKKKGLDSLHPLNTVTKAAAIFTSEKEMLMVGTLIKSEGEEPTAVKPVAGT